MMMNEETSAVRSPQSTAKANKNVNGLIARTGTSGGVRSRCIRGELAKHLNQHQPKELTHVGKTWVNYIS